MPYPDRRNTVRGLLLEAAAVLLGILTAFGLDAGYGVVRERAELRESLSLLRDEFSDARVQLSAVLEVNERAAEAGAAFSSLSPDELLGLSDQEAQDLTLALVRADSFDPGESAIQALVSSNVVEQIEDVELRRLISGWTGMVADLREEQVEVIRVEGTIRDLQAERGVLAPPRGEVWSPQEQLAAWAGVEEIRQFHFARSGVVYLVLREQLPLSERLDRILELLDAALE